MAHDSVEQLYRGPDEENVMKLAANALDLKEAWRALHCLYRSGKRDNEGAPSWTLLCQNSYIQGNVGANQHIHRKPVEYRG
ncbi:uncharacterized protein H6S33_004505 [Morchella sextelata]|uniref:uncharacterized protein n=1 Tax=Morchella sextelata TaxID=1174677 RepID=UPI001D04F52C|nr:uncharacterized protein H6S33_004505 [Morchella sextelata]KAH0606048.1 hypothetical protein H6S33_004505 [Morchella sextelata]